MNLVKKTVIFFMAHRGIRLGCIAIILFFIFREIPVLAEILYRNGLYQCVRFIWDHSVSLLPFPLVYAVIPGIIIYGLYLFRKSIQRGQSWKITIPDFAGRIIALFFILWGFNYACRPIFGHNESRAGSEQVLKSGLLLVNHLNQWQPHNDLMTTGHVSQAEIVAIQSAAEIVLQEVDIAVLGKPNPKAIHGSILRGLGITGIYFPFSIEANIDASLLRIQKIFVAAHEMAHAYGIADEGEADYFAFKVLLLASQKEPIFGYFRHIAYVELLRSVRRRLHITAEHYKSELDSAQGTSLNALLDQIRNNSQLHQEWFPGLQHKLNDGYLKSMGVKSGIGSYDKFLEYAIADLTWQ